MADQCKTCRECDDQEGPVTVTVRRTVLPGKEAEYESWLHETADGASFFPGMMGVNFIRPDGAQQKDYVSIFRFDTYRNLRNWEESEQRADGLKRVTGLVVEEETKMNQVTGLEFWFNLPDVPVNMVPSPHKMALVLMVVVFLLVLMMNLIFGSFLAEFPMIVRIALVVIVQVMLMTYVIMPQVTRLIRPWLYIEPK